LSMQHIAASRLCLVRERRGYRLDFLDSCLHHRRRFVSELCGF
jgi:hypothetical protein